METKPQWWHGEGELPKDNFSLDDEALQRATNALYIAMESKSMKPTDMGNPEDLHEIAGLVVLAFMGYRDRDA